MKRIVVLGGSGMLGGMLADVLSREEDLAIVATARDAIAERRRLAPYCAWEPFDAERSTEADLETLLQGADAAVNAIGVIKPYIRDNNASKVERAIRVNALFPHLLARVAARRGCRVVTIATDCVYSGARGSYVESDPHDPLDVYGKTKSLGEVVRDGVTQLRCSIIGPEARGHRSLLDWFRLQPRGATVSGYTNHLWNGVTTLAFAHLCRGILREAADRRIHIVPKDRIAKADLLRVMAETYGRTDITIVPEATPVGIDRTLATEYSSENLALWRAAGYAEIPTIAEMVRDMAAFGARPGVQV